MQARLPGRECRRGCSLRKAADKLKKCLSQLSALMTVLKAEGVGFEPTEAFTSPVFKTGAINHSTTPPGAGP